ncbi:MAG: hypothetical protein H7Y27_10355 [Gemmatimonadaceae bacterium]|nr:hypothetical protein [Chitinophagaceae bacterium]
MRNGFVLLFVLATAFFSCQKELSVELPNGPVAPPGDSSLRLFEMSFWSYLEVGNREDTGFYKFEYYDSVKTIRTLEGIVYSANDIRFYDNYMQFNNDGYAISVTTDYDTIPTANRYKSIYNRNAANELNKVTYQGMPGSIDTITYTYRKSGSNTIVRFADTSSMGTNGSDYFDLTIGPAGRLIRTSYLPYGMWINTSYDFVYEYDPAGNLAKMISYYPTDTTGNKTYEVTTEMYERDNTKKPLSEYFRRFSGKEFQTGIIGDMSPGFHYGGISEHGTPITKFTSTTRSYENGLLKSTTTIPYVYQNTYDPQGNLIQIYKYENGVIVERVYLKYKKYKN